MCKNSDKNSERVVISQAEARVGGPLAGSRWRHYKGGIYIVIVCAVVEATMEPVVVYRSETYGYVWTRPLREWHQAVVYQGTSVPRFVAEPDAR